MPTALVTGANRGLGIEFVKALRRRGYDVIAAARRPEEAKALARPGVRVVQLDVADEKSIESLAAQLRGVPIDVLVNNAGVTDPNDKKIEGLSFGAFERVFAVNVFGLAVLTKALLPNLRAGGEKKVLNISSQLGSIHDAIPGFSYAYSASKAAVNMITARMSRDLLRDKFTVVSFCPGWNKTDMGGPDAPLDPAESVEQLVATADRLTPDDSGKYLRIDGSAIPF
ncbi:MAG TPA: SDR family oxidoreductase [Phycisphaerales bacterium]|nr:SDR family oxidoreductase [Phycisphaerales bacterium]